MPDLPDIDITPEEWRIVKAILQKKVPGIRVCAFGSRARHTAKTFSDLDLACMTTKPLDMHTLANLADAFDESDLPWKVDILDWASTDEHFRQIITNELIELLPSSKRPITP